MLAGAVLGALAAVLLWSGMAELRPAYLYRERTGEGIGFVVPLVSLVAGGAAAVGLIVALAVASSAVTGRLRTALRVAAAIVTVTVGACALVALAIEGLSGCIGACG